MDVGVDFMCFSVVDAHGSRLNELQLVSDISFRGNTSSEVFLITEIEWIPN